MRKFIFIIILFWFDRASFSIDNLENKIIYLSNGSLFQMDLNSKNTQLIIPENWYVTDFSISPDNKYLACKNIVNCDTIHVENDTTVYRNSLYSIEVINLNTKSLIREVPNSVGGSYQINGWIAKDELLISSGVVELDCWYKYKINDTLLKLPDDEYENKFKFSKDVSNEFYVNNYRVDNNEIMHIFNLVRHKDLIIVKTKNHIVDIGLSNNKDKVIWSEIYDDYYYLNGLKKYKVINKVNILSLSDLKPTELYSELTIEGGGNVDFSPNDSLISLEVGKKSITIINLFTKSRIVIFGYNLCWLNPNTFLYSNFGCIYLYDLKLRKSFLYIKNSDLVKKYNNYAR